MKKTIATILTILLAASTFTACTQASSTEETSTIKPTETLVSTMDESKKPMQETTVSTETVTAETSPVSDKNESSTTEPNKPKKTATSQNSGNVGQNSKVEQVQSDSLQKSQNEAPKQQSKTNSTTENKPKATEAQKAAEKPKSEEKPKAVEKPKEIEKPVEEPKQQSIDFGRVTSALISYGCSLGMVYNGSLNTGNAGWFPPLDVSGYSDTDSVISAGYDEVGYLPYYFSSYAEPGDIAFNVIASNNQIYVTSFFQVNKSVFVVERYIFDNLFTVIMNFVSFSSATRTFVLFSFELSVNMNFFICTLICHIYLQRRKEDVDVKSLTLTDS